MPLRRLIAVCTVAMIVATACAPGATIDDLQAESDADEAGGEPETEATEADRDDPEDDTTEADEDESGPGPAVQALDAPGVIAVGGGVPLRLIDSRGEASAADLTQIAFQPTWSRDGTRVVVATGIGAPGAPLLAQVEVFDGLTGETFGAHTSLRPYFFFSWSHDGSRIAALGDGRLGTTLDILDAQGDLLHEAIVESGSLFLAWEPGGDRLVAHADNEMFLVGPATDATYTAASLGPVGARFITPKWIPGTTDILYATDDGRLVRHPLGADDSDGGDLRDLGEVGGTLGIVVHPAGEVAALIHIPGPPAAGLDDGGTLQTTFSQVNDITAAIEILDLSTGERTPVLDEVAWWAEWSPDGSQLLIATLGDDREADWHLWDGSEVVHVAAFVPTQLFFGRYMVFADQYIEQPRLWAPDSSAFVYSSRTSGGDELRVVAAAAESTPSPIGPGSAAFWSPVVPSP